MERSWAENANQALLFSPDYLASCFEYPGAAFSLAPTIYEGRQPLAFAAAFPRRIFLDGRTLNIAIITFLTAANEYKKRGYGIVIWTELVKRIRAAGFDGMVNYGTEGESMNNMIPKCCHMLRLPTAHVRTIPYWSRMIQSKKTGSARVAHPENVVDQFLELTSNMGEVRLARLWTRDEADWHCNRRFGSIIAQLESGPRFGMLVGYIMEIANAERTKCLIVEDVLWGNLELSERETLVRMLIERAAAGGTKMAVLPLLGYADLEPFYLTRFRPSRRVQHAYLTVWNGTSFMDELPSIYLDII
jgi:hypothetical protein